MSLVQALNGYTSQMPEQLPVKMGQSFIASAALSAFFSSSMGLVALTGAVAATATLIEAIARPIFQAIFPKNPLIGHASSILLAYGSGLSIAGRVAPLFGFTYKMAHPVICYLGWAALNPPDSSSDRTAMAVVL